VAVVPGITCEGGHLTLDECEAVASDKGESWKGVTGDSSDNTNQHESGCLYWPGYGFEYKTNPVAAHACPNGFTCYCSATTTTTALCGQDYAGFEKIEKPDDTKRCNEHGTRLKWMIADSVHACREACEANSNCKAFELQGCAQSGRKMSDLAPDSTCDKVGCALLKDCDAWSAELSGPGRHRAYKTCS